MPAPPPRVRTWNRIDGLPHVQRLALAAVFVALGVVLSSVISIPVGPAKISPTQHLINVLAGVLLGPWYAVLTALAISIIRNGLGTGTFLAFPGSVFGAFLVGWVYYKVRRTDLAAFVEPIGTALIGGLVGYLLIAGLDAPARLLGFITANPPSPLPYLGVFSGAFALIASFAVSSIPGSALGFVMLKALRQANLAPSDEAPPKPAPES
jgi:energy-coupling factor transport system ATP-binding protein